MKFQELFDQRDIVAVKLKECLREFGYTKVSFAEMTGISRPTLDKLLNAEVDSKITFEKHLQKILGALKLSVDEFMRINAKPVKPEAFFSQNAPIDHQMSPKAAEQYSLLLDLVDLCAIYY